MFSERQIENLFQDNLTGDITPADMRLFVEWVAATKQSAIKTITTPKHHDFKDIKKDDIIIINELHNKSGKNGMYVSPSNNPSFASFIPIHTTKNITDFLGLGQDGEVLTVDKGVITWKKPYEYKLKGSMPYQKITNPAFVTPQKGDTYISTTDLHGKSKIGDGIQYNGTDWVNIGTLRGQKGDASQVPGPMGAIGLTGPDGLKGDKGDQGIQGTQGPRGTMGIRGPQGLTGALGLTGPAGATGLKGPSGVSFTMMGTKERKSLLPNQGQPGEIWYVFASPAIDIQNQGHGFFWDDIKGWIDIGDLRGPAGIRGIKGDIGPTGATGPTGIGKDGTDGADGKSAYDVYVDVFTAANLPVQSETDWLKSLHGKDATGGTGGIVGDFTGPAVPSAIGGIKKGTPFNKVPLTDMWRQLLYPYQNPGFASIAVSSNGVKLGNVLPVGTKIGPNLDVTWGYIHPENLENINLVTPDGTKVAVQVSETSKTLVIKPFEFISGGSYSIRIEADKKLPGSGSVAKSVSSAAASFAYYGEITSSDTAHLNGTKPKLESGDVAFITSQKSVLFTNKRYIYVTPEALPSGEASYRYVVYPTTGKKAIKVQQDDFDIPLDSNYDLATAKVIQLTIDGKQEDFYVYISGKLTFGSLKMGIK